MDFESVVKNRRSVRRYLYKPVEREKIERILEAARLSPSAENAQPWRIIVLDEPGVIKKVGSTAFSGIYRPSSFASKAPVLLVFLANPSKIVNIVGKQIRKVEFYLLDMGIVGEHVALAAINEGLGSCWIGWFNEKGVRKTLGIPKKYKIVSLMALGYPAVSPKNEHKRKSEDAIVRFNESF